VHHNKPVRCVNERLYLKGKDGKHYFSATEYFPAESRHIRVRAGEVNKPNACIALKTLIANPKRSGNPSSAKGVRHRARFNLASCPTTPKKVLAAISGTEPMDIPAKGIGRRLTQEALSQHPFDERVQAAFAYVEAKYHAHVLTRGRLLLQAVQEVLRLGRTSVSPVGDESSEARKGRGQRSGGQLVRGFEECTRIAQEPKGSHCCEGARTQAAKAKEKEDNAAATIATPNNPTATRLPGVSRGPLA